MMPGIVSGDPADHCALDTALGLCCDAGPAESERQYEGSNERSHRDGLLVFNQPEVPGPALTAPKGWGS
jgi:hypothetical protein